MRALKQTMTIALVVLLVVTQLPYGNDGNPWPIADGVRIEAEDFDIGGEGIAYHDTGVGNSCGSVTYRDTDVDIQSIDPENGGGYSIAYIEPGEWLEYTVNVTGGQYEVKASVGTPNSPDNPAILHISLEGEPLCTLAFVDTGGWHTWREEVCPLIHVDSGEDRILRLDIGNGGSFNLNWVEFEAVPYQVSLPLVMVGAP